MSPTHSFAPLEPLLAGTLALLHHVAMHRHTPVPGLCPYIACKLSRNLTRLAHDPHLSPPMSAVLLRLAQDWAEQAMDTEQAIEADGHLMEGRHGPVAG
ncbi:hypothetical protein Taqua_02376 [Tepidimonas aquatica]|uniref:Uncharacterized protein n=1 Tax=Tepidimonas aquatica TaxID=247482 RepID=A0A554WAV7_9BURK|nr:hypothetical protein Taqua_02376 [Tepidimonas aquatica]